jgi:tetratricopeptide (TPR) repeat protein
MREVDLAGTLRQLAEALEADGRLPEAEVVYRRAIPVFDRLAADFPAGPFNRWGQTAISFQYTSLLRKLKRPAEAERVYRHSLELFDKLADDFPALPGYRETAFEHRLGFAQFLEEAGRVPEARQVLDEADAMLGKLPPAERSKALRARGHFYGQRGEWDKATADFAQAIDLGSEDVLGVWAPLAVLHVRAGRMVEYRSLCERLLDRLGRTENPWVVAICCLAPNAVADLSRPVLIALQLVEREPRDADRLAILGLALYRKGDWEGAAQRLEASIHSRSGLLGVHGSKLALAMAYQRLGCGAEARQLLREVTRWMDILQVVTGWMDGNAGGKRKEGTGAAVPVPWTYQLGFQLLRREAEETLKQDSAGDHASIGKKRNPD